MVAVVIPSFNVKETILDLLAKIGPVVDRIYLVDDACPQKSGLYVSDNTKDPRIKILFHPVNLGVGGAVKTGYKAALDAGADIIVKLDGDGQMDPLLIPRLIEPLIREEADYIKGNRFYDLGYLKKMPGIRRIGNSMISFINKMTSGYWNIMDPSNGFTAINSVALRSLPLEKIDNRFFFENDMLFRLNTIRAVVQDFPMKAAYGFEKSNLKIWKVLFFFPFMYGNRFIKRIFYNYFLRDFNIGSLELVLTGIFLLFGVIFGGIKWLNSIQTVHPATAGTVLLAGLPVILGFQSLLSFLHYDVANIPKRPLVTLGM